MFKKLLNYIDSEYVDDYINYAEDAIMAVGIYHIAKSYYIMKEIGYYYNLDDENKRIKLLQLNFPFEQFNKIINY